MRVESKTGWIVDRKGRMRVDSKARWKEKEGLRLKVLGGKERT